MPLTDIVIADDEEATELGRSVAPSVRWRRGGIDAKGVDQVKLATLWSLLTRRSFDEVFGDFETLHEESDEGPWVVRVPPPLARVLADLDDATAAEIVPKWAATEEFLLDRWDAGDVGKFLDELRSLARDAESKGKGLLMWMSL